MNALAVWSIKGGVGKTTTAVNLATLTAQAGARVLLWDLDPQGAATYLLRVRARVKGGARRVVRKGSDLTAAIRASDEPNLDLLPADFSYRHLDLELDAKKRPERRLGRKLAAVGKGYDWAILDCPPSVSLTSESMLHAVDAVLVPVVPTALSFNTLEQMRRLVASLGAGAPKLLPFLSMVDRRKRLHRDAVEHIADAREPGFLTTSIPAASVVEQMTVLRAPVVTTAPRSPAAQAFVALWRELMSAL
jgi:chromosome partitioning protein